MAEYSPDAATYQYPDPDDAAYSTRFSWAGDDNEYVPAALRHIPPGSWQDAEANYDDNSQLPVGKSPDYGYEPSSVRGNEPMSDADYEPLERDGSDEDMLLVEEEGADRYDLAMRVRRSHNGAVDNHRESARRESEPTGRRGRRGGLGRGGPGIKRGLRNPIEPEPEFKALHSQATMAFIGNDYDKAESLTLQALQINPEMYPAHSLLSQIHAARGDTDKALVAAWNGAHTRPRDTEMWSRIARMLLDRDKEHKKTTLRDAIYCYTRIISVDKYNVEARYQRAALNRELGKLKQVASEYEQLNKYLPHDTIILRHLAQVSIELNEPERALRHYEAAVSHFVGLEPTDPTSFTWSDINVLAELYIFCQDYDAGLELTKSLSRWLLGRRSDRCWENFTEDDREWDIDNQPRRIEFAHFVPNRYETKTYGVGLPLDLRIKLGIFRLNLYNHNVEEAMNHFEWLDPEDDQIGAKLFDYPDLFQSVAKSLADKGLYQEAIRFYEPLQQVSDQVAASCLSELANCYSAVGQSAKAQECYRSLHAFDDDDNSDGDYDDGEVNIQLAQKRHHSMLSGDEDMSDSDSFESEGQNMQNVDVETQAEKQGRDAEEPNNAMLAPVPAPRPASKRIKKPSAKKEVIEEDKVEELFAQWQSLKSPFQSDEQHSKDQWVSITQFLVRKFMDEKAFFPDQRHHEFLGNTWQGRHLAKRKMREKRSTTESQTDFDADDEPAVVPDGIGGVSLKDWLDVFLKYGLSLAYDGDMDQAYEIMNSATQANVFYHSPESRFLIHVCWFTCALLSDDDETFCSVARWFMKEYQFTTDAYRLFSALNRLSDCNHAWFNCGPSQKYILRQVKAMDFSLAGDGRGRNSYQERSAYTTKDSEGNTVLPQHLDVSLLMLYGYILYAGKSYAYANNYFLRALSVDPDNSIIKLSLALGYIHHALKRQADNRHQLLMQGFAFLFEYHDHRQEEGGVSEKQETAYNVARAYHMLGLTHLATPYYEQCLALSDTVQREYNGTGVEDFAQEAAFALQGIWAASGNEEKALEVTDRWLRL